MMIYGLLLAFLAVATVTDVRRHRIYNWTTYPGILVGLLIRAYVAYDRDNDWWAGLQDGLIGFLACGFLMLFCFVLFNVGGGDVKLIAMMGAFLGLHKGIEALLWTFVLGGIMGTVILIWQFGFLTIIANVARHIRLVFRARGWISLTEEERKPLKRWLFLAPAAFAAVLILIADAEYHFLDRLFAPV